MIRHRIPAIASSLIALFALTCLLTGSMNAQRMRMSPEERVKMLTEQLSLTKVQADSVKKLYEAADKERQKLFESSGGDRSAMREAMGKIMQSVDAQIDSILSVDQRAAFEKIKKERQAGMRGAGPPRRQQE